MFKVNNKKGSRTAAVNVIRMSLYLVSFIVLKPATELKLHTFTINGRERVCDEVFISH